MTEELTIIVPESIRVLDLATHSGLQFVRIQSPAELDKRSQLAQCLRRAADFLDPVNALY